MFVKTTKRTFANSGWNIVAEEIGVHLRMAMLIWQQP